jgi:hypothetical protein
MRLAVLVILLAGDSAAVVTHFNIAARVQRLSAQL